MARQHPIISVIVLTVCIVAGGLNAQSIQLEPQAVAEPVWGLALQPPAGAAVTIPGEGGELMQIRDADGRLALYLSVKRFDYFVTPQQALTYAEDRVRKTHDTGERIDRRETEVRGVQAGIVAFDIPRIRGQGRVLLAEGYVPIHVGAEPSVDSDTYAVLEMEIDIEDRDRAMPVFEAVLATMELAGVGKLLAQREEQAKRGESFLKALTSDGIHERLIAQQLFRIVDAPRDSGGSGKDVGWMRVRQWAGTRVGVAGVHVEVRARFFNDGDAFDAQHNYFVADHGGYEDWSVTTTRRRADTPNAQKAGLTVTETGIRTNGMIDVKIETMDPDQRLGHGPQVFAFQEPLGAYLPQATAWLLPRLLPGDVPATYGFYWYNAEDRKLQFRSDRVEPLLDRYMLLTRAAPTAPELPATYASDGALIDRRLSLTRKLLPTTEAELKRIWPRG